MQWRSDFTAEVAEYADSPLLLGARPIREHVLSDLRVLCGKDLEAVVGDENPWAQAKILRDQQHNLFQALAVSFTG